MYYCGLAQRTITPQKPVYLAGYAARWGNMSQGIHDDLFVKALYVENQDKRVIILVADVEGFQSEVVLRVRERIYELYGISNVSISGTHTHSAPHTYAQVQLCGDELDRGWLSMVKDCLVEVAGDAIAKKFPAKIGVGSINVPEVAQNRRKGHTETDPEMVVLKIKGYDNSVKGILLNYSCHCTVLDANNYYVSADYPGYIYQIMRERHHDAVTLFTNGAAGDINIGYSSDASALGEKMDIRSFENAYEKAKILCDRADSILNQIVTHEDGSLHYIVKPISFPLKPYMPSQDELDENIAQYEDIIASNVSDEVKREVKIKQIYLMCIKLRMHYGFMPGSNFLNGESSIINISDAVFVTVPGELFCTAGIEIKEHFRARFKTAILGYSNGYIGYLPTREAMEAGGYESETSLFANDVSDVFIREVKNVNIP